MEKFQAWLEKTLVPIGTKLSANKYLNILQRSFMATLPLTLSASIALIISYFPFADQFIPEDVMWSIILFLDAVNCATLSLIALYLAGFIGYNFAKTENHDPLLGLVVTMACFLILTPAGWSDELGAAFFDVTWLGSQGILSAMIVGFLAGLIYNKMLNTNIKIKLPDSVPPMVAEPFEALIPSIVTFFVFAVIRAIMDHTPWGSLHALFFNLFQIPLLGLGSSLPAMIIAVIMIQLLWFIGLHGQNIVFAVLNPILIATTYANLEATTNGQPVPYIITGNYVTAFVSMAFFSLVLACLIAAKSEQLKAVAKVSIGPAIFNISEPIVFGSPIVLNVTLLIPWVLVMVVYLVVPYVFMSLGLCPPPTGADIPWTVPPILSGWMTVGSPMGAVVQVINIALGTLIYLPFVRAYDKELLANEAPAEVLPDGDAQ